MSKLTTAQFIEKSNLVHLNKYFYTKTNYINASTKVIITCPIHGDFTQLPSNHYSGHGCRKCSGEQQRLRQRKPLDVFIKEANKVHNNKYNYSYVNYIASNKKVFILCPIHGRFAQTPYSHISGSGCPHCGNTIEEKVFYKKLFDLYKVDLNYICINYKNFCKPCKILCPIHGEFTATPCMMIENKQICPRCSALKKSIIQKDAYIERTKQMLSTNYIYDLSEYPLWVKAYCEKHGSFKVDPYNHLYGQVCPICTKENLQQTRRIHYFLRVKELYKNKYTYCESDYMNKDSIIRITCPVHGEFTLKAGYHGHGTGCPYCSSLSKGEVFIETFLKENSIDFIRQYRYTNCSYKRPLPFDFALVNAKGNIIGLIEFDGEQHFIPKSFFGGEDEFFLLQIKDAIKTDFAKKNKIPLLRASYKDDWLKQLTRFSEELNCITRL